MKILLGATKLPKIPKMKGPFKTLKYEKSMKLSDKAFWRAWYKATYKSKYKPRRK